MGFLNDFMRGLGVNTRSYDAVDAYNDEDDDNYRQRGLENTTSNNGWYYCVKCGKSYRKGDMDIDHIIPKSKGGGNTRDNLQCICKHCNRSKRADMSDTDVDLRRRRAELDRQDKEDREFLKKMTNKK